MPKRTQAVIDVKGWGPICTLLPLIRTRRDLMSNLILDDRRVSNILTNETTDQHAVDQYVSRPTEWMNFSKSDVLYTAPSNDMTILCLLCLWKSRCPTTNS
ncbi:uncharacterized protein BYT42DRAFT_37638 [Radiomyces spectabilis]|uniref:uncharacterized protein n=1 Tax=Radiomyces spectabilis TaxID=64574 RepID=UPI002220B5B6|nr:uncharacterized protein BYT42DRAFT_37638 [Radiomyces spectabilis]KAI8394266.1 hypothetical protein BYT42DRAFT_37638 [Radiomyces spectabilis]